jgi:hypothetical protein
MYVMSLYGKAYARFKVSVVLADFMLTALERWWFYGWFGQFN